MKAENSKYKTKKRTASEIRKLSPKQRNLILENAAKLAEKDYRKDKTLTDFNAFGEDDLYDESSYAE